MKYISAIVAFLVLAFVVNDVLYVWSLEASFRPEHLRLHLQFQLFAASFAWWHLWLTWRARSSSAGTHKKLLLAFIGLCALVFVHSSLWPLFRHGLAEAASGEAFAWQIKGLGFVAAYATLTLALARWGWKVVVNDVQLAVQGPRSPPSAGPRP